MNKKLHKYAETLYHLINFRLSQFKQSRSMLKMDYEASKKDYLDSRT